MAAKVNLDALVPREDFEVDEDATQSLNTQTIQIRDLEPGAFFYPVIRKPDFQRETSDWNAQKILGFVISFLNGDLIPAIILWHSGRYIFVIDGAHRLSALIAWVHDDYGDGQISRDFFEQRISDEQRKIAETTRRIINQKIGSYEEHRFAILNPHKAKPDVVERAERLASLAFQLQWVKGSRDKAEQSFFKINQEAAPIDKTELRLLKARRKPTAVAARAIVRSGTGHKYWSRFNVEARETIESSAREIHKVLFTPVLNTPIKTLDLPIAGHSYSAQTLPLIFDLIEIANEAKADKNDEDDVDGATTTEFLRQTRKIVSRISGTSPASLGLHPAVYFYSASGRYQPTAFLGVVKFVMELERTNGFESFTKSRQKFEEFLLKHKSLPNQVTLKYGSGLKGYAPLQLLFLSILNGIKADLTNEEVVKKLKNDPSFSYLNFEVDVQTSATEDFSTGVKSATFLRDALQNPLRCKICEGLIDRNSITFDHVTRKQDGGLGVMDNAQLAHPYCNSTFKN